MKAYLELLETVRRDGVVKRNRTGVDAISYFGGRFRHDLRNGFPLLTTKKINPKKPLAEMFAFLQGATHVKHFQALDCNIWDAWGLTEEYYRIDNKPFEKIVDEMVQKGHAADATAAKEFLERLDFEYDEHHRTWQRLVGDGDYKALEKFMQTVPEPDNATRWLNKNTDILTTVKVVMNEEGELGPIYGAQWLDFNGAGFNQIDEIIKTLKEKPFSRRMVLTAWNPLAIQSEHTEHDRDGYPLLTSKHFIDASIKDGKMALPPCHLLTVLNVTPDNGEKVLNLHMVMRSCDVPVGLPFNIAGYAYLLSFLAKQTNMIAGELLIDITDAHIYLDQLEGVEEQLKREPKDLPKLNLQVDVDVSAPETLTKTLIDEIVDGLEGYDPAPFIKYPVAV